MMEQMDGNQKTGNNCHFNSSLFTSSFSSKGMFYVLLFFHLQLQTSFFSDLFYTDKGFKQKLTFHLTLFFEICCVRRISVIFFKISWDSSKSQLLEIINIIKLFSIWVAFHRQIICSPAVF